MALRAQASLEYLMNYGWAILVLAFVLSFIVLSGAFSPGSFFKEYCLSPPQLKCSGVQGAYTPDGVIVGVKVSNQFGFPVKVVSAELEFAGQRFRKSLGRTLREGESLALVFSLPKDISAPRAFKDFSVNITYIACEKELNPSCRDVPSLKGNVIVKGLVYLNPTE